MTMRPLIVVEKRHSVGDVAAAATLSATAEEADDEFDKHLLRRAGYVDSRTLFLIASLPFCCQDACVTDFRKYFSKFILTMYA